MQVIPIESVPEVQKNHPRAGLFMFRNIAKGVEGTANNFSLEMVNTFTDFFSPRHKHNFDQFRFQLEGDFSFAKDGESTPGTVIYHPESVSYGPQTSSDESLTLVLQFGGASGAGYMSAAEIDRGIEELKRTGTFEKGIYTRTDDDARKTNQDATEAVWEHINQRSIDYAPPRYQGPIFMDQQNYDWVPVADEAGVSKKLMGVFTERRTDVGFIRLDANATHHMDGPRLYFVVSGAGRADGREYEKYTTVHVAADEDGEITVTAPTEIYFMGLPNFPVGGEQVAA